jgi:hypothetical protein
MEGDYRDPVERREESMTVNLNGERLKENFSQSQEQLLQEKAIQRGRLVKGKHEQEEQKQKEKEMTRGQDSRHDGRAHSAAANRGSDSERRAAKADEGNISEQSQP